MLEDRDYMREAPRRFEWSASIGLVILNAVAFLLQNTLFPSLISENHLALSLEGLSHGRVWQLLTFQFLHSGLWHLLFNCWALYVFGREVEDELGRTRFLLLYLASGVGGGLLHAFAAFAWPSYFNSPVVGASAGVFGVVSAFAMLWPDRRLTLLLFFVIPLNLRARSLLLVNLALTGLGIAFPRSFFAGNVAHVAHLGGILTGLAFVRWNETLARAFNRAQAAARKPSLFNSPQGTSPKNKLPAKPASENYISREVDPILDKISAHGIQSLTEQERKTLEAARKHMSRP